MKLLSEYNKRFKIDLIFSNRYICFACHTLMMARMLSLKRYASICFARGKPPPARFPFLGTRSSAFVAAATFALLARAASFAFSTNSFSIFSRSTRMALGDSGTIGCVTLCWFLHATGRWFSRMLASVDSLN